MTHLKQTVFAAFCLLSAQAFSLEPSLKPGTWVALPSFSSTPETGFRYGTYIMRIFPQDEIGAPQDRLELILHGTTKGNYQSYILSNAYFADGLWHLRSLFSARYWPGYYFGQGNNTNDEVQTFNDRIFEGNLQLSYKLSGNLSIGGSLFAEDHAIKTIKPTPLPESLIGDTGGRYAGVGIKAKYDSRNNIDWPSNGLLVTTGIDWFDEKLSSERNFRTWYAKGSNYKSIGSFVFAGGVSLNSASKGTPFTHLPRSQGSLSLRGANGYRWIDYSALGMQNEIRKPINDKLAVVAFADSYQVAENFKKITLTDFHTSVGGGVRYSVSPDRLNIRLDVGWVDFTDVGFAISIGEAF